MELIRGTTPKINISIKTDIDLQQIAAVWIYISQDSRVKIDKKLDNVTIDYEHRIISVLLDQNDTLSLQEGKAIFQIRLLLMDGTALASEASNVIILPIYKDGIISEE